MTFDFSPLVTALFLVIAAAYALTRRQETPARPVEVALLFIFGLVLLIGGAALNTLVGVSLWGTLLLQGMSYFAAAGYLFFLIGLQQLVRLMSRGNRAE